MSVIVLKRRGARQRIDPDRLREMWSAGEATTKIAQTFGVSKMAVYSRVHSLGLPTRHPTRKSDRPQGAAKAPYGTATHDTTLRRHESIRVRPEDVVALRPDSKAIQHGRSVFPGSVKTARQTERLLVSGHNNRKIGARVEKGAWSGMPIFTLTLEERATCPRSCHVWAKCFGNAMHMARRHAVDGEFERLLRLELQIAALKNPQGFVVRTHVLGDFYSVAYVNLWREMLDALPNLHVYGYTARDPSDTDEDSAAIGRAIRALKWSHAERFRIRWSRRQSIPDGATVIDYLPEDNRIPEGLVCPAETEDTACCATCGLCWSMNTRAETIVFVLHGLSRGRRSDTEPNELMTPDELQEAV